VEKMCGIKKAALANFLGCPADKIYAGGYGEHSFTDLTTDYLVLTEGEAVEEVARQAWSFIGVLDYDFLRGHLSKEIPDAVLSELIGQGCECCLRVIAAFIKDYDRFVDEAIGRYGRVRFICFGDKTEYRAGYAGREFLVYRMV